MNVSLETILLGMKSLRLHALRSILTSLGIILGVASVIVMVSIGEGNKQSALRAIQSLGATNIIVRSQRPPESQQVGSQRRSFVANFGMTAQDLKRLESFIPANAIIPLKTVGSEISRGASRTTSQTFGTIPELKTSANLRVKPGGRYLVQEDLDRRAPVAVIGSEIENLFFPLSDPVGQNLRIDTRVVTIIGVLEPIGLAGGTGSALVGRDLNKDVHIPLTTAKLEFGDIVVRRQAGSFSGEEVEISEIYITAPSTDAVVPMADHIRNVMKVGHPKMQDVEIIVPWELLENVRRTTATMNILLTAIAAISLLVGGIGIMNIMLASVVERTREIGIRRAVGATRSDIAIQFLIETGSLSCVGGLLGIALGIGVSIGLESFLPWILSFSMFSTIGDVGVGLETRITGWSIIASFFVAVGTGLVFGIYPAIIASKQDPIVALRHD
ncbi:MAG TPA: FtsX-like permease family protein [Phycisphaerales bacterium]|nr:FtsX-like permease family protein [Phycisphaerales bacterium]HIB51499.1 FtsX-like permease family protein [Phycisphaerales bacterium]HIN83753.1 FtsX-like permease family protein [Phycisphaerales bacterium]HIO19648.1 FtsX-like permease family protein [Phycisphaerales bacterium]HIO52571.1 FtsX-like permease family protein [Phycisphaerales bacterium]